MQLSDDPEWGLLATTQALSGMGADVKVSSLSIDDQWIVVGCSNNKIYVFNARTGQYVRTLIGHNDEITCLVLISATEPDNINDNHTSINTDLETSTKSNQETVKGYGNESAIVLSGRIDGDLRVWDLANGRCSIISHKISILSLIVIEGTEIAITGSQDGKILWCDLKDGSIIFTAQAFKEPVQFLQSAGESFLAASDTEIQVIRSDTESRKIFQNNDKHAITAIGFDGRFQVSCSLNHIRVFDNKTQKEYNRQSNGNITCSQMNDSKYIYGADNGVVTVLCLLKERLIYNFHHGRKPISCLFADNRFIASGSDDGNVKIWSLFSGSLLYEFCKKSQKIYKICIKDGKCVILFKRGEKTMMDVINFFPLGNIPLAERSAAAVNAAPTAAPATAPTNAENVTPSTGWASTSNTTPVRPVMEQQGTTNHREEQITFGATLQLSENNAVLKLYREDNHDPFTLQDYFNRILA